MDGVCVNSGISEVRSVSELEMEAKKTELEENYGEWHVLCRLLSDLPSSFF